MKIRNIKDYDAYCYLCEDQRNLKLIEGENGNFLCLCEECLKGLRGDKEDKKASIEIFTYKGQTYMEIKDTKRRCDRCEFYNQDCKTLQMRNEIPLCGNSFFIRVGSRIEEVE